MTPYEIEQLKKFVLDNNITEVQLDNRRVVRQHSPYSYNNLYEHSYNEYFAEREETVVKMTIPEDALTKIVNTMEEFNNLMRDPETARLLMEARFINRLKYGSKI